MKYSTNALFFCVAAISVAACATKPPAPPILSIASTSCSINSNVSAAKPLQLAENRPVSLTLDEKAECLQGEMGEKNVYAAFRLPDAPGEYLVSVTSAP